jgi:hypothetical protein
LLIEELDRALFVALGRDGQHLLTLQRALRLFIGNEAEERAQGGEPAVAGFRGAGALVLEMIEERDRECCIQILQTQIRWLPSETCRRKGKQQSEGVAIGRDSMRTGAELGLQPPGEDALNERRERGGAHG